MTAAIENPIQEPGPKVLTQDSVMPPRDSSSPEPLRAEDDWTQKAGAIAQDEYENLHQARVTEETIDEEAAVKESQTFWESFTDKAQDLAEIVCSRESTYRTALDIVGYELPGCFAEATRNIYSFIETTLEGVLAAGSIWLAPRITRTVANIIGKQIFSDESENNAKYYSLFQINELDSLEDAEKAKERILKEEKNDLSFITNLYEKRGTDTKVLREEAEDIRRFIESCELDEEKIEKIKQLKRTTIIAESAIEGGFWGFLPIFLKFFRKYVLGQDRFTGTINYMNEEERKKAGDESKHSFLQKLGMFASMVISPISNILLLNKTKDPKAVEKNGFLKMIKNQFDMTHGAYPKLGLLFSFVTPPNILAELSSAQGKYEFAEKLLRLCTVLPSWWFGHRVTNGVLAKKADEHLAKKYGVKPGILIEPEEVGSWAPEPAKIQHIFDKTKDHKELHKEARKLHAKALYQGFTLHCLGIFVIRYLTTLFTKFRAKKDLSAQKK